MAAEKDRIIAIITEEIQQGKLSPNDLKGISDWLNRDALSLFSAQKDVKFTPNGLLESPLVGIVIFSFQIASYSRSDDWISGGISLKSNVLFYKNAVNPEGIGGTAFRTAEKIGAEQRAIHGNDNGFYRKEGEAVVFTMPATPLSNYLTGGENIPGSLVVYEMMYGGRGDTVSFVFIVPDFLVKPLIMNVSLETIKTLLKELAGKLVPNVVRSLSEAVNIIYAFPQ